MAVVEYAPEPEDGEIKQMESLPSDENEVDTSTPAESVTESKVITTTDGSDVPSLPAVSDEANTT